MRSPFPGMDPYLEAHCGDVHATLIVLARDALQARLPGDLRARIEERIFLESESACLRQVRPDLRVSQTYPAPASQTAVLREGDLAVAEPIIFELHSLPITESYIQIRERGGGKVITVIEFLSPANKSGGAGQEKYLEKQTEVLQSTASLVEIDLVRAGQRVLALPAREIPAQHRRDYLACISPGWKRQSRELFVMPLRQRLPVLPIPLRQHESAVKLDYTAELDPRLSPEDAAWAAELVERAGQG